MTIKRYSKKEGTYSFKKHVFINTAFTEGVPTYSSHTLEHELQAQRAHQLVERVFRIFLVQGKWVS